MARIRSIHPGLASDEVFMTMSMAAKAAWSLLWTECDDHGVFEWKPIVLKARIFPAESLNFADILSEYEDLGCVLKVEVDGKPYGFIRNFCKYQRPKSPSYRLPLPECAKAFVGVSGNPPPVLPQDGGRGSENGAQMKGEGGDEGEGGKEDTGKPASSRAGLPEIDLEEAERRCREAAGSDRLGSFGPVAEILLIGSISLDDALTIIRARPAHNGAVSSWKFYAKILRDKIAERAPQAPAAEQKVFIARDSPEWLESCFAAGHKPSMTTQHPKTGKDGWWFPAAKRIAA